MSSSNNSTEADKLTDLLSNTLTTYNSRLPQYKCRIRDESSQDERRKLLLKQQKEKRDSLINSRRGIEINKDDKWSSEKLYIGDDEMEWTANKKKGWHQRSTHYYNKLMFSEWLLEIPNDLASNWFIVPCPVGKRNLIVTKYNRTMCYTKDGLLKCSFKSALPHKSLLDCIVCPETNTCYVLDVIQWNGMTFINCQTDFRFYWLNSQFQDNPQYSVISDDNEWLILNLPRCLATGHELSNLTNRYPIFAGNIPKLDGLLFYHRETHYTQGFTPLVGWLKAYMLPEALGLEVPNEYLEEKPESYSTFKQFVIDKEERVRQIKAKRSARRKNKMECEDIVTEKRDETGTCTNSENSCESVRSKEKSDCAGMNSECQLETEMVTAME